MAKKLLPGHRDPTDRVELTCDRCGQTDDHPKTHLNTGESYHLDCYNDEASVAILDAAGGKRGLDLAAYLQKG